MPSHSFARWAAERSEALDEIETAHATVGGSDRGRRYATQQINYAYAALLSAQFQGFCRDLHTECVEKVVTRLPGRLQKLTLTQFLWNRSLTKGNPNPGALGADFGRLGFAFWPAVDALDARNARRRAALQELMDWRNAIAHDDFDSVTAGGSATLHLVRVRAWRRALGALAQDFDRVLYNYLTNLLGVPAW